MSRRRAVGRIRDEFGAEFGGGKLRQSQARLRFIVKKMVAALLRKVPPPMKSKPVNATAFSMFGFSFTVATTFCTISSVRSSEEPSGRSTTAM